MGLMNGTLPHAVDLHRPSSGTDGGGGTQLSYSLVTSGIRGILNRASSSEQELFAQQGVTVSHTFVGRGDAPAARGDKLVYGGRSLHVVGIVVNDAIGGIPRHYRLTLNEQL